MHFVSLFSPFSLVLILLSVACFCLSCFFEAQYAQAHGAGTWLSPVVSLLPPTVLAGPETYKNRDDVVLIFSLIVFALAVVLALRRKHWVHWLAVVSAIIITGAILLNVAARL
jgi:hypothetical protein